jgi:DNA polymerase alpha subunit A
VATAEDAAFMARLLGEVDSNAPLGRSSSLRKSNKSKTRSKARAFSPPIEDMKRPAYKKTRFDDGYMPETPPVEANYDDEGFMNGIDTEEIGLSDQPLPSSPITKALERKGVVKEEEEDDEELMEVSQAVGHAGVVTSSVNISGSRPPPNVKKTAYPSPDSSSPTRPPAEGVDASSWNEVNTKLNVLSSPASETVSLGKLKPQDALEEDGSLRMFWLDYLEVNGSLCLFGKVKDKSSGKFVSAFVKIDNMLRKLYFLPREYRSKHGRPTPEEVGMMDVYTEVGELMTKLGVPKYKSKPCEMKYAFELPGVPRKAEYLQLLYPYNKPILPIELQGETFSHVFGTNTALFEQFVLGRKIMGPCWISIKEADFTKVNNASWCKLEAQVSKPELITPIRESEKLETPNLTLMSIALRTMLNVKENKQEILCASARIYHNLSLSDTTPTEKLPCQTFTVIRPVGQSYPLGFETEAGRHRGNIKLEKTEQGLLSVFLAKLQQIDPDVLVGHQLQDVDYSILLNRLRERKTPMWHRIGRMKRNEWPKSISKVGGSFFAERQLVSGRLMCDIANDQGKVK